MKITVNKSLPSIKQGDTFVVFIEKEGLKRKEHTHHHELNKFMSQIDVGYLKGNSGETFFSVSKGSPGIIVTGLGELKKIDRDSLRTAASSVISLCRDKHIEEIHVIPPELKGHDQRDVIRALAEGLHLANYSFDKYQNLPQDEKNPLVKKAVMITRDKVSSLLKEIEIISKNTLLCRDLVNETSDAANPAAIAAMAKKLASLDRVSCRVFNKTELEKMKMGLLLAVNRGSRIQPQLVVLTYTGNPRSSRYVALVGKGITFDSGGVNLKTSGHIETMRMDMAGAAAVMYAFKSAAELKLKKNMYAVMPLTENLISRDAYRPGDIFTAYNGKTVEIGNTDAEGRLILADALAYTARKLKPQYIIDLATLTGACLVALGETVAAYLSTSEELGTMLEKASRITGDKIWQLPLYPEYDENMKSETADISNISVDRNAGTIMGAVFLKNFIDDARWAHIDIAGTAWYSKARGYRPKNATGYGVRLLVELIKSCT